jgi:hypothetical protein
MKLKDFFSKVKDSGKIDNEDFVKFVEAVPDVDFPDTAFGAFEQKFMTFERAIADKEVKRRLRADILDPVDSEIAKILPLLGYDNSHEIAREADTYKKIAGLTKEIPSVLQKASKGVENADEFKKKLSEKDNIITDLTKKFETLESEHKTNVGDVTKGFEKKLHDYRLDTELEKLSSKYTFAEAYEKTREQIQRAMLGDLRSSHKLQLADKEGKADISILNDDGSPRFDGNTPVTIKSLLDKVYEPFLKKSNGTETPAPGTFTAPVTKPNPAFRAGVRNTVG